MGSRLGLFAMTYPKKEHDSNSEIDEIYADMDL